MPPYPWHFGGQRFHNLFVLPEDLTRLHDLSVGICLDVSHSVLAAEHLASDIAAFFSAGATNIKHLHVSDARPPAGEGLPIGRGITDFQRVLDLYNEWCPDASFIIEVWQGHKDFGRLHRDGLEMLAAWGY